MITLFTPTYNRAGKLSRLFESLIKQDDFDFEWLIIDDGSADNTEELVAQFKIKSCFPIKIYRQKNGGKHRAYNKALQLADGEYFFCVDSDDWLSSTAVSAIKKVIETKGDRHPIIAYKCDERGKKLSDDFPEGIVETNLYELQQGYNCKGEFSLIFPIELARSYPFPTFEGEKFVTEAVVYDRIDQVCKMIILPKVVTICEYQQDGLSNNLNRIMKNNPAGYCVYFMQRIDMQHSLVKRFVTAGKYNCFSIFAKTNRCLYNGKNRITVTLAKPLGWGFWLYYKIARKF